MQATPRQLDCLRQLQELDRNRFQAEAQLNDMPHKQQVLDGRAKRKEVEQKYETVSKMLAEAKAQRQKLLDEDERLTQKQEELQEKINEASGDYRSVQTLTRDLEGAAKRKETLEFQGKAAEEKLAQVQQVFDSVEAALATLDQREEALVKDYRAQSEALVQVVNESQAKRGALLNELTDEIVQAYNAALKKCGGVGLAILQGEKCSACRNHIDANRLLQVRREAPLSQCPSCKRVLIVE